MKGEDGKVLNYDEDEESVHADDQEIKSENGEKIGSEKENIDGEDKIKKKTKKKKKP